MAEELSYKLQKELLAAFNENVICNMQHINDKPHSMRYMATKPCHVQPSNESSGTDKSSVITIRLWAIRHPQIDTKVLADESDVLLKSSFARRQI
jgi:hypothetical protein